MKKLILSLSIALSSSLIPCQAQTLDNTFNPTGSIPGLIRQASNSGLGKDIIVRPDGKIYVCFGYNLTGSGPNWDFAITLYNTDGSIDNTFGNNGTTITDFNGDGEWPTKMLLQPDGKIILIGWTDFGSNGEQLAMCRYDVNGNLDGTFGNAGLVTSTFFTINSTFNADGVLQSDGKIVLIGTNHNYTNQTEDLVIARYDVNGIIDNTFATNGLFQYDMAGGDEEGKNVYLATNGNIVFGGYTLPNTAYLGDAFVGQLTPNGTLDPSFGTNGIIYLAPGAGHDLISCITTQSNGKYIVYGSTITTSSNPRAVMFTYRIGKNGMLDNTYGTNGLSITDLTTSSHQVYNTGRVVVQPNDQLFLIGGVDTTCVNNGLSGCAGGYGQDMAIVKLNQNGTTDNTWGNNGLFNMGLGFYGLGLSHESLVSGALQSDGKLLVTGTFENGMELLVMRLNTSVITDIKSLDSGLDENVIMYPNPSQGLISINFGKTLAQSIKVTNALGEILIQKQVDSKTQTIDLSGQPKGVYFVTIKSNSESLTKKIIIN